MLLSSDRGYFFASSHSELRSLVLAPLGDGPWNYLGTEVVANWQRSVEKRRKI